MSAAPENHLRRAAQLPEARALLRRVAVRWVTRACALLGWIGHGTGSSTAQNASWSYNLPDTNKHQAALSVEYMGGRFYLFFNQSGPPWDRAGSGVLIVDENGAIGGMAHWTDSVSVFNALGRDGVVMTTDLGFIVPGSTTDQNGWHSLTVRKVDVSGATQWVSTHTDTVHSVITQQAVIGQDGTIAVVGIRASDLVNGMVWFLDPNGALIGQQEYTGPAGHSLGNIAAHPLGGYVVSGVYNYNGCNSQAWLLRIDATGGIIWSNVHGSPYRDGLGKLVVLPDGSVVAIGNSESSCNASSQQQTWLARYDADGTQLWQTNLGPPGNRWFSSMKLLPDGSGLLMCGSERVDQFYTGWICKYTLDGEQVWCRSIPYDDGVLSNVNAAFYDHIALEDGRIAVTGVVWTPTYASGNIWFMLLDENGHPTTDIHVSAAPPPANGEEAGHLQCHPNPTGGRVTCARASAGLSGDGVWMVQDMLGRTLVVLEGHTFVELDLGRMGLAPGSYRVVHHSERTGSRSTTVLLCGDR